MQYTRELLKEEAKDLIIDTLNGIYNGYLCDLHSEIFNKEYYTDDKKEAEQILDEIGSFKAISECIKYEMDNFGECIDYKKYADPVWVISMYWYIIGEEALYELSDDVEEFDELWNVELTEEESKMLASKFKEKRG